MMFFIFSSFLYSLGFIFIVHDFRMELLIKMVDSSSFGLRKKFIPVDLDLLQSLVLSVLLCYYET